MAEVEKGIENPLPTTTILPKYESSGGDLTISINGMVQLLDALERIQQQLAMINDGENLEPGERHYG